MADQILAVPRQRAFKERAFDEFKRLLVIFLYLWVVFGLLSIHKSLVSRSIIWIPRSTLSRSSMPSSSQRFF